MIFPFLFFKKTGWTPADISTLCWYDPSNPDTVTKSGDLVSQIDDLSGNDYHITQALGPQQPSLDRTIGGLDTLDFDGTEYITRTTDGPYARNVGSVMCASVVQSDDASKASADVFQIRGGGDLARCHFHHRGGFWTVGGRRLDGGGYQYKQFQAVDTDPHVVIWLIDYDNAECNISLDGVWSTAQTFQTAGKTTDTDSAGMGMSYQSSERFDGGQNETILVENDTSSELHDNLYTYLSNKFSL